jgi:SPP1 family predicted phage head-tail adaptor
MNYKGNITSIPTYNDGKFKLYEIKQIDSTYPDEYIKEISNKSMWFKELSISDKLRFEAEQREKTLTMKIRIPQTKEITSMNVLKIGKEYHRVYNAYHFTNSEGFKETDLTLEEYPNAKLEGKEIE